MCGLAGFVQLGGDVAKSKQTLELMADALRHRGPDDMGSFADPRTGYYVGFRRLSIIDTSPSGHQPMSSASGRFVLAMNGEIYNFPELRERVVGREPNWNFRGHSDTEVLLACIELFGWDETIRMAAGMFAISLYDRESKELHLARDRFGEKPLYFGVNSGVLFFGSELKAFCPHPAWQPEISREALRNFFSFGCVPTPQSIYEGIFKLDPGSYITFDLGHGPPVEKARVQYWSLIEAAMAGREHGFEGSEEEAAEELERLLATIIQQESMADVPVGAFLSGGIDSSLVVALMQKHCGQVKTFTIGNEQKRFNEAEFAKKIAEHLGTEHTELYLCKEDLLSVVPRLAKIYDEPFADSSQIPTYLVSKMAREKVTVALSGDGADEIFGGYTRFLVANNLWRKMGKTPKFARATAAKACTALSVETWDRVFDRCKFLPQMALPGTKMHKMSRVLRSKDFDEVYRRLITTWDEPGDIMTGSTNGHHNGTLPKLQTKIEQMMLIDSLNYLPNDILAKVDRATMANSLESRAPYLDHRVAEFAWKLPLSAKVNGAVTKSILRKLLAKQVPTELFDRPKAGFAIPIADWLRSDLRSWAEHLIREGDVWNHDYLNKAAVTGLWDRFINGVPESPDKVWTVLMFIAWHEQNVRSC